MARQIGKLTALEVTRAQRRGYYSDGGGLYLQVGPSGGKSWVFRFKVDGKVHEMGLGSLHTVSLAEARQKALECRKARLDGRDPIAERRAKRMTAKLDAAKAITFKQCAERYIDAHRDGWRNDTHAEQWPTTLAAYVYPHFGDLPVQAVDVGLVMKALEPIWKTKTETASRVRGRIEAVLDWATVSGYRQGDNPARWRGHLEHKLPKKAKVRPVEHHAALPYPEIGAFMAELRQQAGVAARALEFAILTAARAGAVVGARWSEINLAERLWIVPAARMKAGKEHRVPLAAAAMSVLGQLRRDDKALVFPGINKTILLRQLLRMRPGVTVHGFRSSFRDWAAERTNFPAEAAEMALAHTVSDKVEAAYRRGDLLAKRRQLADAWAKYCEAPAIKGGDVVPLRR